jgi:hypothetical protein
MNAEPPVYLLERARRRYELAMLRRAAVRAGLVTAAVTLLVATGVSRLPSPAWLAPVFAAWLFIGWRGGLLWRGALGGLVAGLGALALPLSVLRPCCSPEAMPDGASCSNPEVCVAAGAILGIVVAATLPRTRTVAESARASAGALVAVVSLVACRCTTLFLGESAGLLGGLLASAAGLAAARVWWTRAQARGHR